MTNISCCIGSRPEFLTDTDWYMLIPLAGIRPISATASAAAHMTWMAAWPRRSCTTEWQVWSLWSGNRWHKIDQNWMFGVQTSSPKKSKQPMLFKNLMKGKPSFGKTLGRIVVGNNYIDSNCKMVVRQDDEGSDHNFLRGLSLSHFATCLENIRSLHSLCFQWAREMVRRCMVLRHPQLHPSFKKLVLQGGPLLLLLPMWLPRPVHLWILDLLNMMKHDCHWHSFFFATG